jgi:hypothetical protein
MALFGKPPDPGPGFATRQGLSMEPEGRLVYGCVGADRPEATPFIDEVDGILVFTWPGMSRENHAALLPEGMRLFSVR